MNDITELIIKFLNNYQGNVANNCKTHERFKVSWENQTILYELEFFQNVRHEK